MRIIALLLLTSLTARAQVLTYPLDGNLRAEEGTIEFFFRLEDEPSGASVRGCHYFPIFNIQFEGEKVPRLNLSYQTIWNTNSFHFFFSTSGYLLGKLTVNPYITSVEDTQPVVKGETGQFRFPRTSRLRKGDWHHLALTWTGAAPSTLNLYLDGKVSILSNTPPASLWNNWEGSKLSFLTYVYHDNFTMDDLRISAVARTQEEAAAAFTKGEVQADRFTLLLDKFEGTTSGVRPDKLTEFVEGRIGKGLKILKAQ